MQSVQDLRSKAVDRKRDHKCKAKWGHKWNEGQAIAGLRAGPDKKIRPLEEFTTRKNYTNLRRHRNAKENNSANVSRKQDVLGDGRDDEEYESLESDRDTSLESTSPPGRGFDGTCLDGTSVLGTAVTRAVRKYEDGQTTKLVKEEYDDLADISEDEKRLSTPDDDDFELI